MPDPSGPPRFPPGGTRQTIRAEKGISYGVVGADIHVFGDGTPLYLLRSWPDPEHPTGGPRRPGLDRLHHWRENGPRLSARWLYAPEGRGPAALTAHFAEESAAAGWKAVAATRVATARDRESDVRAPAPDPPAPALPGRQDCSPAGFDGLLLTIDSADRWPLTHLTWLFSNALLHRPTTPTRILLTAHTADPWPAIRAALADHQASTSTDPLFSHPDPEAPPAP
ncbi:hypothetical protein ACWF94_06835 [Streptomyces sp. NPDC055078]